MIRRFIQRELQFLLDELSVPSFRILLYRIAFGVSFTAIIGLALFGLLAFEAHFGLAAAAAVVFVLFVVALRLEGQAPAYMGDDWTGTDPRLPGRRPLLPRSRSVTGSKPLTSRSRSGNILPPPS
jgi:hypothetical protein